MEIREVNEDNIKTFSLVLKEAANWLNSINQPMWNIEDLAPEELLLKYKIDEMKLCYEDNKLIGAYILQWYDPLFWSDLNRKEAGILHKLAVCREYSGKGYGRKLIVSAEQLCKEAGVDTLRLNCGTFRPRLRKFYESAGFQMVDRVFIDQRDQIRYVKAIN